jgi:lysophospholipase L1-like esterase
VPLGELAPESSCSKALDGCVSVRFRLRHFLLALLTALSATVWSGTGAAEQLLRCGRFSGGEMPAATPRADRHALDRLERINDLVKSVPHSVIFFGDSLTEGWDPSIWNQQLAPRGVMNAGISGDRTDHLLWRLEHGNLDGPPAKAVILLIGTNDLSSSRSPEASADGISANLTLLRRRLPYARILLLGLLPREQSPNSPLRRAVEQVNALIRSCADGEHVFYAEIGNVLLDGSGRLNAAMSPDHLHLSERGYALLASQLGPALDRLTATGR